MTSEPDISVGELDRTVERLRRERPGPSAQFADELRAQLDADRRPNGPNPDIKRRVAIYAASAFGLLALVAIDLAGVVGIASF